MSSRFINVLLGLDETANALFGGLPRETISGTIGRALLEPKPPLWAKFARWLVDGVLGQGHCVTNGRDELERRIADVGT